MNLESACVQHFNFFFFWLHAVVRAVLDVSFSFSIILQWSINANLVFTQYHKMYFRNGIDFSLLHQNLIHKHKFKMWLVVGVGVKINSSYSNNFQMFMRSHCHAHSNCAMAVYNNSYSYIYLSSAEILCYAVLPWQK